MITFSVTRRRRLGVYAWHSSMAPTSLVLVSRCAPAFLFLVDNWKIKGNTVHAHIQIYAFTQIHTQVHSQTHSYTCLHTFACTFAHLHIYIYLYIKIYTQTHMICKYMYIYIHVHICICIYIYIFAQIFANK